MTPCSLLGGGNGITDADSPNLYDVETFFSRFSVWLAEGAGLSAAAADSTALPSVEW